MRQTKKAIDSFQYEGDGKSRDVRWDSSLPGFGVRIYPTGQKSFVLSYRFKGRAEVYVDSGVRRGSDVIKALALGARAVAIGRPLYWGLAVDGADGVHGVLELLREEVDRCLAYCGQTSVRDLEPNLVNIPQGWGSGRTAP